MRIPTTRSPLLFGSYYFIKCDGLASTRLQSILSSLAGLGLQKASARFPPFSVHFISVYCERALNSLVSLGMILTILVCAVVGAYGQTSVNIFFRFDKNISSISDTNWINHFPFSESLNQRWSDMGGSETINSERFREGFLLHVYIWSIGSDIQQIAQDLVTNITDTPLIVLVGPLSEIVYTSEAVSLTELTTSTPLPTTSTPTISEYIYIDIDFGENLEYLDWNVRFSFRAYLREFFMSAGSPWASMSFNGSIAHVQYENNNTNQELLQTVAANITDTPLSITLGDIVFTSVSVSLGLTPSTTISTTISPNTMDDISIKIPFNGSRDNLSIENKYLFDDNFDEFLTSRWSDFGGSVSEPNRVFYFIEEEQNLLQIRYDNTTTNQLFLQWLAEYIVNNAPVSIPAGEIVYTMQPASFIGFTPSSTISPTISLTPSPTTAPPTPSSAPTAPTAPPPTTSEPSGGDDDESGLEPWQLAVIGVSVGVVVLGGIAYAVRYSRQSQALKSRFAHTYEAFSDNFW